jgi:large subunit ribosomal protein L24
MRKIKRDDEVVVIAGRDKGKRGKVVRVMADDRLVVSGINMIKKHQKPNTQAQPPIPGGIVEKEAPIQVSNVAIFNAATQKADRIGFKILEDGKKIRVFKSSGEAVDA